MNKSNDVTGDRITNALKGDKEAYRENWDKIFGSKDMKKHVQQITGDVPHTVVEGAGNKNPPIQMWMNKEHYDFIMGHGEEFLDKITQDNEDTGVIGD